MGKDLDIVLWRFYAFFKEDQSATLGVKKAVVGCISTAAIRKIRPNITLLRCHCLSNTFVLLFLYPLSFDVNSFIGLNTYLLFKNFYFNKK